MMDQSNEHPNELSNEHSNQKQEPMATVAIDSSRITLLGTAHVSRTSADKVRELLATGDYDAVAVELCPSRYNAIVDPDALSRMDLFRVIKDGKVSMVAASLALGAFQQRAAEQMGIQPGAEMRAAIECAQAGALPVLLIDREVGTTLKRIYRNVPWWRRMNLFAGLLASVVSSEKVSEAEIERLKEGDILESTFAQFAEEEKDLFKPLIDERDRYMVARLREEVAKHSHEHVLAVVGAGHLAGMRKYLDDTQLAFDSPQEEIANLDQVPPGSPWLKFLPWIILAFIVLGFALGFSQNPELGWQMVVDWVVIIGGLAALGSLIAGAHPLTVISAFVAAPLTVLHPAIGIGMVTAPVEIYLRKPNVGDFSRLRSDATSLKGWWRNRVTRTLLVFMFSSLGTVIGTYVAGFRIYDRLSG